MLRKTKNPNRMIATTEHGIEYEIIFREINSDVPEHLNAGVHWYVEAWDGDALFPRGTAFVCNGGLGAFVDFIIVQDGCRERGIGGMLIDAIAKRWPGAQETDGISEGGEILADRLEQHRLRYLNKLAQERKKLARKSCVNATEQK